MSDEYGTQPLKREATLCILVRGDPPAQVLLGLKKAGFATGKVNGIGGKIEPGETVTAATVRELEEEAGVRVAEKDLIPAGHLTFLFPFKPAWNQTVHVFLAHRWDGEPGESLEIAPAWYRVEAIPFERMWHDNAHWLPRILAGERIRAVYTYGQDNETVQSTELLPWDAAET
jgi:8-oxo-dGTP diphosphatase